MFAFGALVVNYFYHKAHKEKNTKFTKGYEKSLG